MKQYDLKEETITLKVKKSPAFVRGIMFFFAFVSFLLPIIGIIMTISSGKGIHFLSVIGLFLFGLIGFYLLRTSLWNTYGKETIKLQTSTIEYEANYGWFKDGKKSISLNNPVFSFNKISGGNSENGVLVIEDETEKIESVIKMPINQIEELIGKIKLLPTPYIANGGVWF